MVDALLRSLNVGRACAIFDGGLGKFDIAAICHEVRCVNTQVGETLCITLSDVEHRVAGEDLHSLGTVAIIKSQAEDVVLVLKVWATRDTPPFSKHAEKRHVGEVRIPLRHLSDLCNCMLYFTWVNLESAGLNDSVAHLGYGNPFAANSSESFLQGIMSNPRQLFQPKACISLCRADELAETDRLLWTKDLPRQDRIKRWGPLLRSQQQHAVMCTAQNLEAAAQQNGTGDLPQRLMHLRAQADEQAQEIELLQEQLQSASRVTTAPTSAEALDVLLNGGDQWRQKPSMTLLEERTSRQLEEARGLAMQTEAALARRGRDAEAHKELETQQSLSTQLRGELQSYEVELSKLGEEANNKIEAANIRIRALRRERDEASRSLAERREGNQKLQLLLEELEDEKSQLAQQKETLMRMVEDLHACCNEAGLPAADRASIDSISGFKLPS
ncbi:Uso1 [Symbiodinium natans]|uniref:Uso1 protein n=1 Tax=Symbiodinium natans TaxID=878477 RepID=A0A812TQK3_9DINO|nr:Uso1 [Symbiodinium natans]